MTRIPRNAIRVSQEPAPWGKPAHTPADLTASLRVCTNQCRIVHPSDWPTAYVIEYRSNTDDWPRWNRIVPEPWVDMTKLSSVLREIEDREMAADGRYEYRYRRIA